MNRWYLYVPIFASLLAVGCGDTDPTTDGTIEYDEVVGEATETVRDTPEKVLCHIKFGGCSLKGCKVTFYAAHRANGWRKVSLGHIRCRSKAACVRKGLAEYSVIVEREGYFPLVTGIEDLNVDKCGQIPFR